MKPTRIYLLGLMETCALFAGIDIGAATSKAIIINSDIEVLGYSIIPTSYDLRQSGEHVFKLTLGKVDWEDDLDYIVSTGYGRRSITFPKKAVPEIICHAKGTKHLLPKTKTIIDIGGQDSKVIEIDERGDVLTFAMNDRCAAGTGRFLEVLSKILDLEIENLGPISLKSEKACTLSSTCTVFAESEVISYLASGEARENIIAGLHKAIAKRIVTLGRTAQISYVNDVALTGGVAKNVGVKKAIEEELGKKTLVPDEPQITAALGAALLAHEETTKIEKDF